MRPAPYDSLLDEETWAFVDKSVAFYPENATSLDYQGQRDVYDALCKAFDAGRPSGVSVRDHSLPGAVSPIFVREYRLSQRHSASNRAVSSWRRLHPWRVGEP
ncbi:hypothetical protein [Hoeflea alexandrii]|uniref:hypothetical protein n=1 Tax=Hoeflea alexandrii TaxID=288436 RepID=UPI002D1E3EDA|nr:hypothetical protein [Hoeflea alexandrii]